MMYKGNRYLRRIHSLIEISVYLCLTWAARLRCLLQCPCNIMNHNKIFIYKLYQTTHK